MSWCRRPDGPSGLREETRSCADRGDAVCKRQENAATTARLPARLRGIDVTHTLGAVIVVRARALTWECWNWHVLPHCPLWPAPPPCPFLHAPLPTCISAPVGPLPSSETLCFPLT